MADIEIDTSLNVHLGLPENYQLDKKEAFQLYMHFQSMLETKHPIGTLMLDYYIGFNGGAFITGEPTNRRDEIVKAIVENMNFKDQLEVRDTAEKYPEPFDNETN